MTYADFSREVMVSVDDLCRDYFRSDRNGIRIKKESVAVRNLAAIIQATLKLSCRKGFDAMSLRDLSGESGLSMGALYTYFASKEDLLSLIQSHGQAAVTKILSKTIGIEGDARSRLRTAIRTHIYLSESMKDWFYFFFMETKNLGKKYRKAPIESELMTERIITDILEEGVRGREFRVDHVTLTGSVIKAMMQDWYLKQWKYARRKISVDQYADFVIRFVESFVIESR